ncbi:MAG: hypothetical protein AAF433_09165 [Bacteroidota bacterium]
MVEIQEVTLNGERFYKIANSDLMRPFFMSIVSDSNHWMFIASNGGLSAGRKNSEYALFPYYTDDKITEFAEITGSKSIFQVKKGDKTEVWEPFSIRQEGRFKTSTNLYKNHYGNAIIFEEINHDLQLCFRYRWNSSNAYGFVRTATLINQSEEATEISLLDGLQNIIPYGVGSEIQNRSSNLVDAYKRTELHATSGLGIYALSAIIVDKAEPSEALKANVVWSYGLPSVSYLLSSLQLDAFREQQPIRPEEDVKGEKGAYFLHQELELAAGEETSWTIVANVNQNHAAVAQLIHAIEQDDQLANKVADDVQLGTQRLIALCSAADGLQKTNDQRYDTRHFSNVLFNIMRGGIFDHNYQIERADFSNYLAKANQPLYQTHRSTVDELATDFSLPTLKAIAEQSGDPDFQRLCLEYLPLKFSRRHGDPSRPWNRFSINTHSEVDGSKILDYEGNWRDIFQNWEALAHAYPSFIEGMILKFLNASTFDGYNPYRVTKGGFDWETIEADDPWSYIGYWGDHQIIYLLKFLEFAEQHQPGQLASYFEREFFVYANVPYRIKPHQKILQNPKDTIDFDHEADGEIRQLRREMGADGALLRNASGQIHRVNFLEKLLASVLAKLSNFIPEGGIWMNTQRPEWNDANNALVGNGVSMVTLCYLRRFLAFFEQILVGLDIKEVALSAELLQFYQTIHGSLQSHQSLLNGSINDKERKQLLDAVGEAASDFRLKIYQHSFQGKKQRLALEDLRAFISLSLSYLEHSIEANRRADHLYHAYNLMTVKGDEVTISYLSEMLEGQVAVLSAKYLSSEAALKVLDAMKSSALFREDQYSYILYPNKQLPGFLARNHVPAEVQKKSLLVQKLLQDGNRQIIEQDINGELHFNGNFKNAADLDQALTALADTPYGDLAADGRDYLLAVFEQVFNHKAFTGRSGTFYGYEGLGSIYWHMVSKLLLAVQECCLKAIKEGADAAIIGGLLDHYYEIKAGIGVHKSPSLYGAFPTDPYSHTPAGKGAQQPGMTGQVKEDILSRFGELGVQVNGGQLAFHPQLLQRNEFQETASSFSYVDLEGQQQQVEVPADGLCFTYCQVPIIYRIAEKEKLVVHLSNGEIRTSAGLHLDHDSSTQVFQRSGTIARIEVSLTPDHLR